MSAIEIRHLKKSYRVYQKKEGLWASVTGLMHREYKEVEAVRGPHFAVLQATVALLEAAVLRHAAQHCTFSLE